MSSAILSANARARAHCREIRETTTPTTMSGGDVRKTQRRRENVRAFRSSTPRVCEQRVIFIMAVLCGCILDWRNSVRARRESETAKACALQICCRAIGLKCFVGSVGAPSNRNATRIILRFSICECALDAPVVVCIKRDIRKWG